MARMMEPAMSEQRYGVGTLVRARHRLWIVLPSDDPELLRLRPLDGDDSEQQLIFLPLEGEDVTPATLPLPNPARAGHSVGARLLREAARLGLRATAGPLRSTGRLLFTPRAYQLVPLLMALRLDPVRLLIADDVGIGKTIEAGMILRELLDRGEVMRSCVLCPPPLCEQWASELEEKFGIEAQVVRPGTVATLERGLPVTESLFDHYPHTVVSIDFIKSDRRRASFLERCPELVIVDEAHGAAEGRGQSAAAGRAAQQRHALVQDLTKRADRHVILLTATPHSGDPLSFASLIGLLQPELGAALAQLAEHDGQVMAAQRQELARFFVQRRRADISRYLGDETPFPQRRTTEVAYRLTEDYAHFLQQVLDYTRELVTADGGGSSFQQRVRWWAALALLRCASSSPAAAASALRNRVSLRLERLAQAAAAPQSSDVDAFFSSNIFDTETSEQLDDTVPPADTESDEDDATEEQREERALRRLARLAEKLGGAGDQKLATATAQVRQLLADGFQPIVFCRYLATARYLKDWLQEHLEKEQITVELVTGEQTPEERAERVQELGKAARRVLVATDCLAEGINLQESFDAVVHYDLAWNPTRHEQREGRVDRFGQQRPEVRAVMLYGSNNPVDGAVLRVLLRKAAEIRRVLGVSVPIPEDPEKVIEAIMHTVILQARRAEQLPLFPEEQQVEQSWQLAAEREKERRTLFAQHALHPEEVQRELLAARAAVGTPAAVEQFCHEVCSHLGVPLQQENRHVRLRVSELPPAVRFRLPWENESEVRLRFHEEGDGILLHRLHPLVEALAQYTLGQALEDAPGPAARCAVIRTKEVAERHVLLVLHLRFTIDQEHSGVRRELLAEECLLAAFHGDPDQPQWLDEETAQQLATLLPSGNVIPELARRQLEGLLAPDHAWHRQLLDLAQQRATLLQEAHRRVRQASGRGGSGLRVRVRPQGQPDVLGAYVLLPDAR